MWTHTVASICVGIGLCVTVMLIMNQRKDVDYSGFHQMHCNPRMGALAQRQAIPKKIYRTWKTTALPAIFQTAWDYTERHNPEYEQILFTDEMCRDFMKSFMGGYAKHAYDMLVPGAARADLFRYCIMYEYGGVYLDGKSGAGPLRNLIGSDDRMIVSTWGTVVGRPEMAGFYRFGEFQQWWLACEPRHPFMKQLIISVVESVEKRLSSQDLMKHSTLVFWYNIDVLHLTGPLKFSNEIIKYTSQNGSGIRMVCANGNGIMTYDVSGKHGMGVGYGNAGPMLKHPSYVWPNYYVAER